MADIIKQMTDTDDNNVYPVSKQEAIYDNDGNTLDVVIADLKKSVSDGKTLVADSITQKGVATNPTDTFQTMAEHISQISGGGKFTLDGSVLQTKTVSIDREYNTVIALTAGINEPCKITVKRDGTSSSNYPVVTLKHNDTEYNVGTMSGSTASKTIDGSFNLNAGDTLSLIRTTTAGSGARAYLIIQSA